MSWRNARSSIGSSLVCVFVAAGMNLTATSGCSSEPECTVPDGVQTDWIRTLGCQRDYELLWTDRVDSVFARTRTINWLIDREQNGRVFFINSAEFNLHFEFANAYLNIPTLTPVGTHADFNILNYRRDNRRFVLGKLIRYIDQGLATVEFSAGDTANAQMIVSAFKTISDAVYDGASLKYRPVSADQEKMLGEIAASIPTIASEEVFRGQTLQPLHAAIGYGTLRFRRVGELGGRPLAPTDIAVLDRVPTDLALVSGVITDEFQTPLSHVNILSKNRGTPNMALRGAFEDPELRDLEDTLVRLTVTSQGYEIESATLTAAQAFWDSLRPTEPLVPELDLTVTGLVELKQANAESASSIGAKAANLAELGTFSAPLRLPQTPIAIPFSAFNDHLVSHGLDVVIEELLADVEASEIDADELAARLFELRWRIFQAPMDPTLGATLMTTITTDFGAGAQLRFRSSTNAEDLADFSGAGLYTSAGAGVDEGAVAVAKAVKVVWASTWNLAAFVERDFYRVDHRRVRMAVLIHPAFEKELANGVAVTINEFAENRPAYYINSQVGEVSVTNPTGLAIPEQILYYTWYEDPEYEVITRSSLLTGTDASEGRGVLTEVELAELADALEAIHSHFRVKLGGGAGFAMDVEFKIDSERNLVIKQARPLKQR